VQEGAKPSLEELVNRHNDVLKSALSQIIVEHNNLNVAIESIKILDAQQKAIRDAVKSTSKTLTSFMVLTGAVVLFGIATLNLILWGK
jgi:hypothetical protein